MRIVAWLMGFALLSVPVGAGARPIVFVTGQIDSIRSPDLFLLAAQQSFQGRGTTVMLQDLRPGTTFDFRVDFNTWDFEVNVNGKRLFTEMLLWVTMQGEDQIGFTALLSPSERGNFDALFNFVIPIPDELRQFSFEDLELEMPPPPNTLQARVHLGGNRLTGAIAGRILTTRVEAAEPAGLGALAGLALAGLAWRRALRSRN